MRHVSVISGHPICTGFRGLTGCQQDPRDMGRHSLVFDDGRPLVLGDREDIGGYRAYLRCDQDQTTCIPARR